MKGAHLPKASSRFARILRGGRRPRRPVVAHGGARARRPAPANRRGVVPRRSPEGAAQRQHAGSPVEPVAENPLEVHPSPQRRRVQVREVHVAVPLRRPIASELPRSASTRRSPVGKPRPAADRGVNVEGTVATTATRTPAGGHSPARPRRPAASAGRPSRARLVHRRGSAAGRRRTRRRAPSPARATPPPAGAARRPVGAGTRTDGVSASRPRRDRGSVQISHGGSDLCVTVRNAPAPKTTSADHPLELSRPARCLSDGIDARYADPGRGGRHRVHGRRAGGRALHELASGPARGRGGSPGEPAPGITNDGCKRSQENPRSPW